MMEDSYVSLAAFLLVLGRSVFKAFSGVGSW